MRFLKSSFITSSILLMLLILLQKKKFNSLIIILSLLLLKSTESSKDKNDLQSFKPCQITNTNHNPTSDKSEKFSISENTNVTNDDGHCMYIWDCFKTDGRNLGLCKLEPGIYGTCCFHNSSQNAIYQIESFNNQSESLESNKLNQSTTPLPVTENLKVETTTEINTDYENVELMEINEPVLDIRDFMNKCGKPEMSFNSSTQNNVDQNSTKSLGDARIVGGEASHVGQWPWVVSIRRASLFGYTSTHSCGGVILNENWILTAAHCIGGLSKSLIRVRIGDLDFKSEVDNELHPFLERKVERKIIHPSYNYSSFENDLGLLKLSESIKFNPNVRPLCLPPPPYGGMNISYTGLNGTLIGWGRTSENGQYSQKQLSVTLPIISNKQCMNMFKLSGRNEMIPDHFVCAGFSQGGRDGCQGDSGGPLNVRDANGRWFLVGIMSWGIGCGEKNQPGVFTRVSLYTDWIIQHAV